MCDADRERYGGPEWVSFDVDALQDMPASALHEIEAAMDMTIAEILVLRDRRSARSLRAQVFIARRLAGVDEKWDDFDPAVLRLRAVTDLADTQDDPGKDEAPPPSPDSSPDEA